MDVDLVSVETEDGLALDGALRKHELGSTSRLPVDVVICHHGTEGNFYRRYLFDGIGDSLLAEGCDVLRVNNRGHDQVFTTASGRYGTAFEIVDDCRYDWKAWLDFAEARGYKRIALWGQSMGAVKTIYYLATVGDARVKCAICSSPSRYSYRKNSADPIVGERLQSAFYRAQDLVARGKPEGLVHVMGFSWIGARSFLDLAGPEDRYDFFRHLPDLETPLLITLGSEEGGVQYQDLASRGPSLSMEYPNIQFRMIEGADHSYMTRIPQLWSAARGFLEGLAAA